MRIIGSMILLLLPQPGLGEAFEELHDVWAFHCERAELGPPTPPNSTPWRGRVVETVERPALAIED
jgi:hypothetical protein